MNSKAEQKTFDFPRAAKLGALERIRVGGKVKSLLKALDGFIQNEPCFEVSQERIATSMGCSSKTVCRAIKAAEVAGLLFVWDQKSKDKKRGGKKLTFRIEWAKIFDLPDALTQPKKRRRTSDILSQPPRTSCPITSDNLAEHVGQIVPRTSDNLTDPGAPDHFDQYDHHRPDALQMVGGGSEKNSKTESVGAVRAPTRPVPFQSGAAHFRKAGGQPNAERLGNWTSLISRKDLDRDSVRDKLRDDAINAGYLTNSEKDRMRFSAAIHRARKDQSVTNPGGWLKEVIEFGRWNYLRPIDFQFAWHQIYPGQKIPELHLATLRGVAAGGVASRETPSDGDR